MSSRIFNELKEIELKEDASMENKYELAKPNDTVIKPNQLFIGIKSGETPEDEDEQLGLFVYIVDGVNEDIKSISFDDTSYGFIKNEITNVNELLVKLHFPYGEEVNNSSKYEEKLNKFLGDDEDEGDGNE